MAERANPNISAFPNHRITMPFAECVADIAPERVTWLSMGRLAVGKMTLLDGDPGLSKSTMMLDWAARISRGEPLPDGPKNRPRGVIILSAEDGKHDTIRPRLDAAGADLSRIFLFWMRDEEGQTFLPGLPGDISALMSQIEATDASMVIIDPLMAFLTGDVKSHNDQDVRRALEPLASGLERTGAAGIISRHLNKSAGMAGIYRGGGSIGIIGAARFGLIVGRDPDEEAGDRRILASQKCNIGKEPASLVYRLESVAGTDVARIVWEGESLHRASALTDGPKDPAARAGLVEAAEWLSETLAGGSVAANELKRMAKADGLTWRTIEEAKKSAGVISGKAGFGRSAHWVWRLSDPSQPGAYAKTADHEESDEID